ncbi:MAG: hypothetical protein MK085_08165 [Phycisphaerales bacterium]|nr:hypothetical protein [Phycisphaerales bacterium]
MRPYHGSCQPLLGGAFLNGLVAGLVMAMAWLATGCSSKPAAATNEVFTPREAFGSQGPALVAAQPALDDALASRVLNGGDRSQIWSAFVTMARGTVSQLKPARNGVRFSDVPLAATNAANDIEMAIVDTRHHLPRLDIQYRDREGFRATLKITFDSRRPLVDVEYATPTEEARLPRAKVRAEAMRAIQRLRAISLDLVLEAGVEAIEQNGGTVLGVHEEPERYAFELLMLDGQPARLEVTRLPPPEVVRWEAWAGVFPNPDSASRIGESFEREIRAWGRIPEMPVQPGIFDTSAN